MDLTAVKERITRDKRKTDVAEACRRVGVTDSVFRLAMGKSDSTQLEPAQERILSAMIDILDERKAIHQKFAVQCSTN